MNILFLTDNFPPENNAPATRTFEHAVRWVQLGHTVTIVTCFPNFPQGKVHEGYRNRWRSFEEFHGMKVVRVKTYITANEGFLSRILDYVSFMFTGAIAGCLQPRPDLVVATSPQFFCALAGWFVSRVKRVPFVLEIRDLWPASIVAVGAMPDSFLIRMLERLELWLYRQASRLVVVTQSFKSDMIKRGISPRKISVVFNGVDKILFQAAAKDPELLARYDLQGKFVIGYIGTFGLAHDLKNVLEAVRMLIPVEHIRFLLIGAGAETRMVSNFIAEHTLTNARLLEQKPRVEIPGFMNLCDLCLVPLKNNEVFSTVIPSKLFECLAMHVPVVMSLPEGEATAIVRDLGCGVTVPPGCPELLSQAIERLSRDPATMQKLRANCEKAAGSYSRDQLARNMLSVLTHAGDDLNTKSE